MFGKYFYNKNIRNIVILFGTLFHDINIRRSQNNTLIQDLKVPIAYGPAQKYLAKIEQGSTDDEDFRIGISLPRMSFEITSMVYDNARKLQTTQQIKSLDPNSTDKLLSTYTPVPYNYEVDLSIMVLNSDDGAQILEQILPYFTPEFQVTMNEMKTLGIKRDIPIILNSMTSEDDYEGDFLTRRTLVHTLSFTIQGHIYKPVSEQGIIREVDVNAGTFTSEFDTKLINIDIKPSPTDTEANMTTDPNVTTTITNL